MCVIMIAEKRHIKLEELLAGEQTNPHGGGIAWREKNIVKWHKGLTAKQIWELMEDNKPKLPYVVHFRITSSGNRTTQLTHPFPVEWNADTKLEGEAERVLFQNGTWRDWENVLIPSLIAAKKELPSGEFNDTRAMAIIVALAGERVINLLDGTSRWAIVTPSKVRYWGSFTNHDGVLMSSPIYNYYEAKKFKRAYEWAPKDPKHNISTCTDLNCPICNAYYKS